MERLLAMWLPEQLYQLKIKKVKLKSGGGIQWSSRLANLNKIAYFRSVVNTETNNLLQRAADELKRAGAREIYVFGSVARGKTEGGSDLDLAVSGLPPAIFYRMGARISDLIGRAVDLVDLDVNTPFTRYLRTENELVRVG